MDAMVLVVDRQVVLTLMAAGATIRQKFRGVAMQMETDLRKLTK